MGEMGGEGNEGQLEGEREVEGRRMKWVGSE